MPPLLAENNDPIEVEVRLEYFVDWLEETNTQNRSLAEANALMFLENGEKGSAVSEHEKRVRLLLARNAFNSMDPYLGLAHLKNASLDPNFFYELRSLIDQIHNPVGNRIGEIILYLEKNPDSPAQNYLKISASIDFINLRDYEFALEQLQSISRQELDGNVQHSVIVLEMYVLYNLGREAEALGRYEEFVEDRDRKGVWDNPYQVGLDSLFHSEKINLVNRTTNNMRLFPEDSEEYLYSELMRIITNSELMNHPHDYTIILQDFSALWEKLSLIDTEYSGYIKASVSRWGLSLSQRSNLDNQKTLWLDRYMTTDNVFEINK